MVTGVLKATKNLKYLESKFLNNLFIIWYRGGIAVVWLGKKNDKLVAMKQFPKVKGKSVDGSAYIEFQIQELLAKYSNPNGKIKIQ